MLDRINEQVADNGHVTLTARADDRAQQCGKSRIADVVGIEAVVITGNEDVADKHEIRVRKVQETRPRLRTFVVEILLVIRIARVDLELFNELFRVLESRRFPIHRATCRVLRVEKAGRLG